MGQAKTRGSYEQRQAEGIARLEREADERQRRANEVKAQERQRLANLAASNPQQYAREKSRGLVLLGLLAMAAGMLATPGDKLKR